MANADPRALIMLLLANRASDATICPSEIARATAADATDPSSEDAWRAMMPIVHTAVDQLLADGLVQLSWKGRLLAKREGPYRIRRASPPA